MTEQTTAAYVVGDIHGCFREYTLLQEQIKQHAAQNGWKPLIISTGDLTDRGPDTAETVEHFAGGCQAASHIAVAGNHECEFIRIFESWHPEIWLGKSTVPWPYYLNRIEDEYQEHTEIRSSFPRFNEYRTFLLTAWLRQGGRETMESYGQNPEHPRSWILPLHHLKFLSSLPLYWENQDIIVTHALVRQADFERIRLLESLDPAQKSCFLSQGQKIAAREASASFLWNRTPITRPLHPKKIHISGHTPYTQAIFTKHLNQILLDTGCVYGRRLSAWCQRTESFIFVASKTCWNLPAAT